MTREELGQIVRQVWVDYCMEMGDAKPSHLAPWGELNEQDREVDRRIGETLFNMGKKAGIRAASRLVVKTFRDSV